MHVFKDLMVWMKNFGWESKQGLTPPFAVGRSYRRLFQLKKKNSKALVNDVTLFGLIKCAKWLLSKKKDSKALFRPRLVAFVKFYCLSHQMFRHMHKLLHTNYLRN